MVVTLLLVSMCYSFVPLKDEEDKMLSLGPPSWVRVW